MALLYLASGAGEETGGGERVRAVRMLSGAGGRLRAPCVRHCVRVRRDSHVFMQHQQEQAGQTRRPAKRDRDASEMCAVWLWQVV